MSRQQIFYTKRYQRIEKAIVKLLNSQPDFLSARTASSPRAIGDATPGNPVRQLSIFAWRSMP